MNERVMQFRIGLFVIVSGLVLTMMVVWFGETPSLLRDQVYLKVRYAEAPGVLEGVPVRKSGIRIGEVMAIAFDERPDQPEGVIVTLALERRYHLRKGAVPKLTRSLIGDVAIDMEPGTSNEIVETGKTPATAPPPIEGQVAPDPSKALAAATKAFEKAGDTLESINSAAKGLAKLTDSSEKLDQFLTTWRTTGQNVSGAAQGIKKFIADNEGNFQPALADLRKVAAKFNDTLDPETQKALKDAINRFSSAAGRMDSGLAELEPAFKDVGAKTDQNPTTDIGQAVRRLNLALRDIELLTSKLRDPQGRLNADGSLQKLLIRSDLHDNLNNMALSADQAFRQLGRVLGTLRQFAEKIASDPSVIGRGVLGPR
jgi:phospholipid/cholesterol/gamma-HCH transport system substrate-binding protein